MVPLEHYDYASGKKGSHNSHRHQVHGGDDVRLVTCGLYLLVAGLETVLGDVECRSEDQVQSHHLSQDRWAQDLPNEVNPQEELQHS